MEITKYNFSDTLPQIQEDVRDSTFIAIDCEFTGLFSDLKINLWESPEEYFRKVHLASRDFLIVQFGLCIFKYDQELKLFKVKAYSFYIFPRKLHKSMADEQFMCSSEAIQFHVANGLNWAKVFTEGISYLNKDNQEKLRESLGRIVITPNNEDLKNFEVPTDAVDYVDDVVSEVHKFLESDAFELVLSPQKSYLRAILHKAIQKEFKDQVYLETRMVNNVRAMVVIKPKPKEMIEEERRQLMLEAVGFSRLVDFISQSRKLIAGHNMLLDILHIVNRFITKVPDELDDFMECIQCIFPRLVDTKHVATTLNGIVDCTILGPMARSFATSPFRLADFVFENSNGVQYSLEDPHEHDAAYDAFLTGVSLISMWDHLASSYSKNQDVFTDIDFLNSYMNKIYMSRVMDSAFLRLDGPQPQPNRDYVFHLTVPSTWKNHDIARLFNSFGAIRTSRINDTSVYVGLVKRELWRRAYKSLLQQTDVKVLTYAEHQRSLRKPATVDTISTIAEPNMDGEFILVTSKRAKRKTALVHKFGSPSKQGKQESTSNKDVPTMLSDDIKIEKTFEEDENWE